MGLFFYLVTDAGYLLSLSAAKVKNAATAFSCGKKSYTLNKCQRVLINS